MNPNGSYKRRGSLRRWLEYLCNDRDGEEGIDYKVIEAIELSRLGD